MTHPTLHPVPPTRRRTRVSALRALGTVACLIGALAVPVTTGPAMAQDGPLGPVTLDDWTGWLGHHLAMENAILAPVEIGPGTATWSRHLELEYPS